MIVQQGVATGSPFVNLVIPHLEAGRTYPGSEIASPGHADHPGHAWSLIYGLGAWLLFELTVLTFDRCLDRSLGATHHAPARTGQPTPTSWPRAIPPAKPLLSDPPGWGRAITPCIPRDDRRPSGPIDQDREGSGATMSTGMSQWWGPVFDASGLSPRYAPIDARTLQLCRTIGILAHGSHIGPVEGKIDIVRFERRRMCRCPAPASGCEHASYDRANIPARSRSSPFFGSAVSGCKAKSRASRLLPVRSRSASCSTGTKRVMYWGTSNSASTRARARSPIARAASGSSSRRERASASALGVAGAPPEGLYPHHE